MTALTDKETPHYGRALLIFESCLQWFQSKARRSHTRDWTDDILQVIADLEQLNGTTEADFLAVGQKLMDFLSSARRLHADLEGLSSLVSGEQAQRACEALISVRSYVQDMQRRSSDSGHALLAIQASATEIQRGYSALPKIVLSFRVAAILARIETAHLAGCQSDLGNLAEEMNSRSDDIQWRAEQILEAAAAFDARIASTLAEFSRLEAIQVKDLPSLLAEVDADLETFEARRQHAQAESLKITDSLGDVTNDLSTITTAIQFHDITRQQIEHVIQALSDLARNASGQATSSSTAPVLNLQKAQLKSAASAFGGSTEKIDADLRDISSRVTAMAAASNCLLGLDHDQSDSFLSQMQQRFEKILAAIEESQALEGATRAIIADLEDLSARLRSSLAEMQTIEIQLSRISINAAISACHIGAPGEPLNMVARAFQSLQMECAAHSQHAAEALGSIAAAIQTLGEGAAPESLAGPGHLLDAVRNSMSDLRASSEASSDAASTVASLAAAFCHRLEETREHSKIGGLFVETVTRCCDALDSVIAHLEPGGFSPEPLAATELAERYTMQAEREVHQSVTGVTSPPDADPASDDNVEFF